MMPILVPVKKVMDTVRSFDYQWRRLAGLLSDPLWRARVDSYILDELDISPVWQGGFKSFKSKKILDVGCGNGRWSFGFVKLECEVFGFDTSPNGVEYARQHINGVFDVVDIMDRDRLLGFYGRESFDLVWCWGVLHHTGDPRQAFKNIAELVKPEGVLHIYVYGKKSRVNHILRWIFNRFSLRNRERLAKLMSRVVGTTHSNFDAFSPSLASEHTEYEVRDWFEENVFSFIRNHPTWCGKSTDIFATGIKKCQVK